MYLIVQPDHGPGEGAGDHLEKVRGVGDAAVAAGLLLLVHVPDQVAGEMLQVVGAALQPHEEDDGEPVEHVVHRGAGEGPLELLPVTHLRRKRRRFQGCGIELNLMIKIGIDGLVWEQVNSAVTRNMVGPGQLDVIFC